MGAAHLAAQRGAILAELRRVFLAGHDGERRRSERRPVRPDAEHDPRWQRNHFHAPHANKRGPWYIESNHSFTHQPTCKPIEHVIFDPQTARSV